MTQTIQTRDLTLNYQDNELEQFITTRNQELLNQTEQQGKKDGFANKPSKKESYKPYTHFLTTDFNLLISEVNGKLQAKNQLKFGSQDAQEAKERQQQLELEKSACENQIKNYPKATAFPISALLKFLFALLLSGGILLGEQEFIAKSLQVTGSGFLTNRLLAIGITVAILVIAHLSHLWTSKIQKPLLRRITVFGIGLLIGSVFFALAIFRQQYFQQVGQNGMPLWSFVLINILFFYAFYLCSTYLLTPSYKALKTKLSELKNVIERKRLEAKHKKITKEIAENRATLYQSQKARLAVLSYAQTTEARILRLYEQAMSKYVQSNRETRTETPPEIAEEIPQLTTYYQDLNLNPKN